MVSSRSRSVRALVSLLCGLSAGGVVAVRAAAGDPIRITAVANLTLRAMPSADAPAVAQLPLGTEVTEAGPLGLEKTWLRVRLSDAREGWVQARLTLALDPAWPWPTFDEIIARRLGRRGDGFSANAELVAFIERVLPEYTDPEGRARVELSRLRALTTTLESLPAGGDRREPFASWLATRQREVVFDEPGAKWILASDAIWALHATQAGTSMADDIAWFAVATGIAGECEGRLPCYLDARNRLQGEYLRWHPGGRHAADAVGAIARTARALAAPSASRASYVFDRTTDCQAVVVSVDALAAAVKGSRVVSSEPALESLSAIRRGCQ